MRAGPPPDFLRKVILGLPQGGEYFRIAGMFQTEMGAYFGALGPEKGIGRTLIRHHRRQGEFTLGPKSIHFTRTLLQCLISRLHTQRKAGIGLRIFVAAIKGGVAG